jgi:hypothetical protein
VCRLQPRRIAKRVAVFAKPPFRQSEVLHEVVARETEIKAWRREKKLALIRENNPTWEDMLRTGVNRRPSSFAILLAKSRFLTAKSRSE